MKKQIKDVKVVMDRIGVRTATRKSVIYVPSVTVTFNDPQIPMKNKLFMKISAEILRGGDFLYLCKIVDTNKHKKL